MQLLSINHVLEAVPFGKSKLYELVKAGAFPAPLKISPGRSAWVRSEIDDWISERITERDCERLES
ncbi:MAG: AlpA family phage regulatory protein [Pseudomonadota bacterium]